MYRHAVELHELQQQRAMLDAAIRLKEHDAAHAATKYATASQVVNKELEQAQGNLQAVRLRHALAVARWYTDFLGDRRLSRSASV